MRSMLMLILVTIVPVGSALGQDACPNRRATQVEARVRDFGPFRRCAVGIRLLGRDLGLLGGKCPRMRLITPAHQVCGGIYNPGTFCEYENVLAVQRLSCDCSFETVVAGPGVDLIGGGCECQNDGTAGSVQDAQTSTCP